MRTYRRWFLTGAILLLLPLVIVNYARSNGDGDETKIRWDIISVNFATGTLSAGGIASARANDNSKLTLTGSGTFEPNDPEEVTGGGLGRRSTRAVQPPGAALTGSRDS